MTLSIRVRLAILPAVLILLVAGACTTAPAAPTLAPLPDVSTVVSASATLANTPVLVAFPTAAPPSLATAPATSTVPGPTPTAGRITVAPPVVQMIAPANNTQISLGQTINVVAVSASDSGISRVELYADGGLVQTENAPAFTPSFPLAIAWSSTQQGNHVLRIVAYDANNAAGAGDEITVSVIPDVRRPSAVILSPIGIPQVELGNIVQVQAVATDEQGIIQMDLYVDNQFYTYTTPPSIEPLSPFPTVFAWTATTPGNHTLIVRAHDAQDQTADSTTLKVFVADTHPPVVNAFFDRTSAPVGEPITITLTAVDVGGIQRLELWSGKEISATSTSSNPARQTYMTVQIPWQNNNPGDYSLSARAYNANGNMKESPAQIVTVLRAGQPAPTRQPSRTPTATRPPRPSPTARLQPPPPPTAEIAQPADHFANMWPIRVVFGGKASAELDRIEAWGYYAGQLYPQLICSIDARTTTQKRAQCDWSPTQAGTVFLFAQAFDIYNQIGRSTPISGYVGLPGAPSATPPPIALAGRWLATTPAGQYTATFRPVGSAMRGDFKATAPNLPGGEVAGRIPSGTIKGDRVTFHVDFSAAPAASATSGPDAPTAAPPTNAPALLPALDFDCGVDASGTLLDCKTKDARGQSGAAQFRRQ